MSVAKTLMTVPTDLVARIAAGVAGVEEATVVQERTEVLAKMANDYADLTERVRKLSDIALTALRDGDLDLAIHQLQTMKGLD